MLEDPVLLEQQGGLNPLEPENRRIEQGEQQFAHTVAVVPLGEAHVGGHGILEPNPRQEEMQEIGASVVRQAPRPERDREFSRPSGQFGEPYLIGSIHRRRLSPLGAKPPLEGSVGYSHGQATGKHGNYNLVI